LLSSQMMWNQVQGSTNYGSQVFNAPLGSFKPLVSAESASMSLAATGASRRVNATVARTMTDRASSDPAAVGAIGVRQG
jgi:hypothetical protein